MGLSITPCIQGLRISEFMFRKDYTGIFSGPLMHKFSKGMLIFGGTLTLVSLIMMIIGYSTYIPELLDNSENGENLQLILTGGAPASWDASDIDTSDDYFVYASYGDDLEVELIGADEYNYFIPCDSTNNCNLGIEANGASYSYVGELYAIGNRDVRTLEFSGSADFRIYSSSVPDGLMAAGIGIWGCCCGVIFLLIGGISVAMIKDEPKNMVIIQNLGSNAAPFSSPNNQSTIHQTSMIAQNQQPVQGHISPAQTGVLMSTAIDSNPTQTTGPNAAMNGVFDENGYEWLDYEGRKYWRPQGSNSTWYPHKQS